MSETSEGMAFSRVIDGGCGLEDVVAFSERGATGTYEHLRRVMRATGGLRPERAADDGDVLVDLIAASGEIVDTYTIAGDRVDWVLHDWMRLPRSFRLDPTTDRG